ncbi:unnamed protein product [Albugo candida]|uniref:Uncharacterized protein n=1 Tax=Albugo candida TaxID=65357 RepID=A0A024GI83_9STRA|nr:unnamed protein product [Albugo candida]|eukprot:CCI46242.1 unnamed protein product [Albugo candida]
MTSSNRTKVSETIRPARDAAYSTSNTTVESFHERLSIRQIDSQTRKEKFIEWKLQKEHEKKYRHEPVSSRSDLPVTFSSMSQSRGPLNKVDSRLPKKKQQSKLLEIRKHFMESPTMEQAKLEREGGTQQESHSIDTEYVQASLHKRGTNDHQKLTANTTIESTASRIPRTPCKIPSTRSNTNPNNIEQSRTQSHDQSSVENIVKPGFIQQINGNQKEDVVGQQDPQIYTNNQVEMDIVEESNNESPQYIERTQTTSTIKNQSDESAIIVAESEVIIGTTHPTLDTETPIYDCKEEDSSMKSDYRGGQPTNEVDTNIMIEEKIASAETENKDDDIHKLIERLDYENEAVIADETSEQGSFWQNELEDLDLIQDQFDVPDTRIRATHIVEETPQSGSTTKSTNTSETVALPENEPKITSTWWFRCALVAALTYLLFNSYPWILLPADLLLLGWLQVLGQAARYLNNGENVVYKLGDALAQATFQLPPEIFTFWKFTLEKSFSTYHAVAGFLTVWSRVLRDYAVVAALLARAACIDSTIGIINGMSWIGSLMSHEGTHGGDEAAAKQTQKLQEIQQEQDSVLSEVLSRLNEGEEEALRKIADMRARRETFESLTDSILAEARDAALESIREATEEATSQIKNYALAVSKIYAKELEAELATHKALVEEEVALAESEAEYEANLLENEGREMVKEVEKLDEEVQHIAEDLDVDGITTDDKETFLGKSTDFDAEDEEKELKIQVVVQEEEIVRVFDKESHLVAESVSKVKALVEDEKRVGKTVMPEDIASIVKDVQQVTEHSHVLDDKVVNNSPISDRWMKRLATRSKEAVVMTLAVSVIAVIAFSIRRILLRRKRANFRRRALHPKRWQLQAEATELLDDNEDDVAEFIPAATTDTEPEPESGDCNWESSSTISSHDDYRTNMSDNIEMEAPTVVRRSQRVRMVSTRSR